VNNRFDKNNFFQKKPKAIFLVTSTCSVMLLSSNSYINKRKNMILQSYKNYLSALVFVSLLNAGSILCMKKDKGDNGYRMVQAGGGLLLAGVCSWAGEAASNQPAIKKFSEKTGVSAKDTGNVLGIASGMFALSVMTDPETGSGLRNLSWRAPIAGFVAGVVCTKTFLDVASHIPVIGKFVSCSNSQCKGMCDECRITKMTIAIGVYRAVDFGLSTMIPDAAQGISKPENA
jgi:hypothetical protein